MNELTKGLQKRLKQAESILKQNKKDGKMSLHNDNAFDFYADSCFLFISSLRARSADIKEHYKLMGHWRDKVKNIDIFSFSNPLLVCQVLGELGYLLNRTPDEKEAKYFTDVHGAIDTTSAMAVNFYLGRHPEEGLPYPGKKEKKYTDILRKLVKEPRAYMRDAEKYYASRENNSYYIHKWHGGGPFNKVFLDPLILCVLKYKKVNFDEKSIHLEGYKYLVKQSF